MTPWLSVVRFVHIFSAIFWVGTTLFMALFLEPTVRALGPEGGRFMQRLLNGTRFSLAISAAGILTILAGLLLYWPMTEFSPPIIFGSRLPLTLGALAGIASAVVGFAFSGRASGRMQALGREIAAGGGPPQPEQLAEMGQLQATLRAGGRLAAVLMILAVVGMVW